MPNSRITSANNSTSDSPTNSTKGLGRSFSYSPIQFTPVSLKVWFFLAVIAFVHLFIGFKLGGRPGLFIGLLMAMTLNALIFYYGESQLLEKFKTKKLEGQDAWGLLDLAQKYSKLAGTPPPTIRLIISKNVFAFSLGHTWTRASICISQGMLEKLTAEEIEAVVAHQVCHIRRLDTFAFGVASALANSLVGLAYVLDQTWPINWFRKEGYHKPFMAIISPLAWLLIRFAVSDRNYYENDDLAASLLPQRKILATALWKIESYCQTQPLDVAPCTNHLFIVNPDGLRQQNWFYLSHPKIENRIRRLIGSYPI